MCVCVCVCVCLCVCVCVITCSINYYRYVLRNKPDEWNDQLRGCVMDAYDSVLELLGMMQVGQLLQSLKQSDNVIEFSD